MDDLICCDCGSEFEDIDVEDGCCPECGSKKYDFKFDVEE